MMLYFRGQFIQHYTGDCPKYRVSKVNEHVKLVEYFGIWGNVDVEKSVKESLKEIQTLL